MPKAKSPKGIELSPDSKSIKIWSNNQGQALSVGIINLRKISVFDEIYDQHMGTNKMLGIKGMAIYGYLILGVETCWQEQYECET